MNRDTDDRVAVALEEFMKEADSMLEAVKQIQLPDMNNITAVDEFDKTTDNVINQYHGLINSWFELEKKYNGNILSRMKRAIISALTGKKRKMPGKNETWQYLNLIGYVIGGISYLLKGMKHEAQYIKTNDIEHGRRARSFYERVLGLWEWHKYSRNNGEYNEFMNTYPEEFNELSEMIQEYGLLARNRMVE